MYSRLYYTFDQICINVLVERFIIEYRLSFMVMGLMVITGNTSFLKIPSSSSYFGKLIYIILYTVICLVKAFLKINML